MIQTKLRYLCRILTNPPKIVQHCKILKDATNWIARDQNQTRKSTKSEARQRYLIVISKTHVKETKDTTKLTFSVRKISRTNQHEKYFPSRLHQVFHWWLYCDRSFTADLIATGLSLPTLLHRVFHRWLTQIPNNVLRPTRKLRITNFSLSPLPNRFRTNND